MTEFLKKYRLQVSLGVLYLICSTLILQSFQKSYYCHDQTCQFWPSAGFFLMNITLGWIVCYYGLAIIFKYSLTTLLKIVFPLVFILYSLGMYYFFGNFNLIVGDDYITGDTILRTPEKYSIKEIEYFYKSGYSGDGADYYSFKLTDGRSVSVNDDRSMYFLQNNYHIPFR